MQQYNYNKGTGEDSATGIVHLAYLPVVKNHMRRNATLTVFILMLIKKETDICIALTDSEV